jgi:hypothetical protein
MPDRRCGHGFLHYNYDDPADLRELVENGLIWRASQTAQKRAVDALLSGDLPVNDRVPPRIAEWVTARQAEKGA